ncbi:MAG TPA: hemerythrin domain-containing protein [Burkholderiales bacterium]|nr:hemerythrin domain-containing protein [Burkholderiales bacterium]
MTRTRSKTNEALSMLKDDHDRVEKSFKEFEKLDREDAETAYHLAMTVCADLKVHTTLEEEIFYPAVREAIDDEDVMNEAGVEHETAKMLIEQLENMQPDDPNFHATFIVLGEYVMHHVKEEEGEMFPAAKKSDLDFDDLAQRMKERREELAGETERAQA